MVPEMRPADDIRNSFGFHPGTQSVVQKYRAIRNHFEDLALYINEHCPPSRELAVALTKLEEAQMWAIKSVAVNSTPLGEEGAGYREHTDRKPS